NFGTVIGAALRMSFRMTTQASENFADSLHTHGDVLEAIRMRESETARRLMAGLIGVAARDLGRAASQRGQDTAAAL
ncbi:FCD domain-containing protein, partial [Marinovum sp.]|uniref:FCD domain-containing protein n=1 Tax=Marinovum sp. TaxID=2024839 RepID=UPI002B2727EB